MPDWDKDRPDGGVAWNLGDNDIRNNNDFLEQYLQAVGTFALNPANPTDRAATKVLQGLVASRPVTTVAAQTGIIYFANDAGAWRLFVCTDGATNTWIELSKVNALTVGGLLTLSAGMTASGTSTFNGAVQATAGVTLLSAGNLTLATGRKIEGPAGESWLRESGVNMSPFTHASARHRLTGSDGAWVGALDALGGLINGVHSGSSAAVTGLTNAFVSFASVTRNFTGRGSATSKVLALGIVRVSAAANEVEIRIAADGAASAFANTVRYKSPSGTAGDTDIVVFDWFTGLSAASHTFAVQAQYTVAGGAHQSSKLLILDLGNQTIEGGV